MVDKNENATKDKVINLRKIKENIKRENIVPKDDLVSLFDGILTFLGFFNPKTILAGVICGCVPFSRV